MVSQTALIFSFLLAVASSQDYSNNDLQRRNLGVVDHGVGVRGSNGGIHQVRNGNTGFIGNQGIVKGNAYQSNNQVRTGVRAINLGSNKNFKAVNNGFQGNSFRRGSFRNTNNVGKVGNGKLSSGLRLADNFHGNNGIVQHPQNSAGTRDFHPVNGAVGRGSVHGQLGNQLHDGISNGFVSGRGIQRNFDSGVHNQVNRGINDGFQTNVGGSFNNGLRNGKFITGAQSGIVAPVNGRINGNLAGRNLQNTKSPINFGKVGSKDQGFSNTGINQKKSFETFGQTSGVFQDNNKNSGGFATFRNDAFGSDFDAKDSGIFGTGNSNNGLGVFGKGSTGFVDGNGLTVDHHDGIVGSTNGNSFGVGNKQLVGKVVRQPTGFIAQNNGVRRNVGIAAADHQNGFVAGNNAEAHKIGQVHNGVGVADHHNGFVQRTNGVIGKGVRSGVADHQNGFVARNNGIVGNGVRPNLINPTIGAADHHNGFVVRNNGINGVGHTNVGSLGADHQNGFIVRGNGIGQGRLGTKGGNSVGLVAADHNNGFVVGNNGINGNRIHGNIVNPHGNSNIGIVGSAENQNGLVARNIVGGAADHENGFVTGRNLGVSADHENGFVTGSNLGGAVAHPNGFVAGNIVGGAADHQNGILARNIVGGSADHQNGFVTRNNLGGASGHGSVVAGNGLGVNGNVNKNGFNSFQTNDGVLSNNGLHGNANNVVLRNNANNGFKNNLGNQFSQQNVRQIPVVRNQNVGQFHGGLDNHVH